jgi:hypothetical protein
MGYGKSLGTAWFIIKCIAFNIVSLNDPNLIRVHIAHPNLSVIPYLISTAAFNHFICYKKLRLVIHD